MIRIRRGVALEVESRRAGVVEVLVEVDGAKDRAIAYTSLTGPVEPGDRVVLNTGAVALGLGTGGLHFVIAVEGGGDVNPPDHGGHAMKLRYTPMQHAVEPVEETHRESLDRFDGLDGCPVVVASLHSALAPAALAARADASRRPRRLRHDRRRRAPGRVQRDRRRAEGGGTPRYHDHVRPGVRWGSRGGEPVLGPRRGARRRGGRPRRR